MKEENANMAARYEREIPEGYEARIEGNKVIIEPKESEDERIRKWLIEMYEACAEIEEKQKEQKPAESISQLTVKGKGVYKICPHCKERMVRDDSKVYTSMPPQYGYNCPKCGTIEFDTVMYDNPEMEEQKPAEIKVVYPDDPKRKEIGFYYNKKEVSWEDMLLTDRMHDYPYYFRDGMDYYPFMPDAKRDEIDYDLGRERGMDAGIEYVLNHLELYGLCKSAKWSDKDESYLQTVISEMEANKKEAREYEHKIYDTIILWLKSLTERFNLQPEQKWDEKDEEMLLSAIEYVQTYPAHRQSVVDWLKSLLERFNLQPKQEWSEEDEKEKYENEGVITNAGGLFGYDVAAFRFDDNHVFTVLLPHDENARYGDKVKLTVTKEK